MPPNTDETATLGSDPHNLSVETVMFLDEDFHLIDDPAEHEPRRDELEAADDRERRAESAAPQSADKPVREGDETPGTNIAERDKADRLRGAVDSAAGALRRGAAGIGKAAGTLGDGMPGSARAVGGHVGDVSGRAGRFASEALRKVPVRRLHQPVTSTAASVGNALLGAWKTIAEAMPDEGWLQRRWF